jgi:hypothetical protein
MRRAVPSRALDGAPTPFVTCRDRHWRTRLCDLAVVIGRVSRAIRVSAGHELVQRFEYEDSAYDGLARVPRLRENAGLRGPSEIEVCEINFINRRR